MMGVSQSIAECRYFLDSLNGDGEHNLVLPCAGARAPARLERRSPRWGGRRAELFQSQGAAALRAEGCADHRDYFGIDWELWTE